MPGLTDRVHHIINDEHDERRGQDRIEAIEKSSVTGQPVAHVFDTDDALELGLAEVAPHRREENGNREDRGEPQWQVKHEGDHEPARDE